MLVTGGASGIGRLVAERLAALGARLVLWDLDPEALHRTVPAVEAHGRHTVAGYVCDVGDRTQVYETARRVRDEVGSVDVLVNNAGVVSGQRFLDLPDEKIEATFRVNTLALFWTGKAFLPDMIARNRGHVVTMASASGYVGVARLADYAASKWAAVGFDESLRMELRRLAPGVKTTVVCPFYVATGMFAGVRSRFGSLLPILEPAAVADRIVRALRRDQRRVVMPRLVGLLPLARIMPVAAFDAVVDFLGVNTSMDEFVGRRTGPDA